jgi:hypothetical protein
MVGRVHTIEPVGLLYVSSTHLKTLFDGMSWSLQRNRVLPSKRVFKCIEFTFNNPTFLWYDHDLLPKRVFKCIEFTFNNPTVSLV